MRSIIRNSLLVCGLLLNTFIYAQEVTEVDSTGTVRNNEQVDIKKDSIRPFQKFKAEGVSAVVGEYVILDSDIDKSYLELQSQGISVEDITRCQLLGKLMEDKLYAHQAKLDSIPISDSDIDYQVEQQISYMVNELGSEEKVAKYYRKNDITELKKDLFEVNKTMQMASSMQQKVVEGVEVTPEEVRNFFYSIPENERPVFGAELELAQIVIEPKVSEEAKQKVIDQLNQIRTDIVENGASFATKAVLYSMDGTRSKGGLITGIKKNSPFAKEFKDQVFSLLEGEVSEPFETEFGFHIVYLEKIRGQELDVRHIIIIPEASQDEISNARARLGSIRDSIVNGSINFSDAARIYSTDTETRNNGGLLVNPVSLDTRFDLTKMDPTLSAQVYNLREGEITKVLADNDRTGKVRFKIMTVIKRYEEHPADYVKDYEKIQELALKEKQLKAIEDWQEKKIKETYINVNEDYKDCEFSSNWLKK